MATSRAPRIVIIIINHPHHRPLHSSTLALRRPEGGVKYIRLPEFVVAGISCLGYLGGHVGVSKPCRSYPSAYAVTVLSVFYPSYIQNLERPSRGRNRRMVRDIPTPGTKLSRKPGGRTRRRTRRYSRTRWGFYETIRNNYMPALAISGRRPRS